MSETVSCRALKRDGERCSNRPRIAGFCRVHYPKPENRILDKIRDRTKIVGNTVVVAASSIKLVEEMVKLWASLPFGHGPRMPPDYEYLADCVGAFYPELPSKYTPFTKGADTVDWRQARSVYDKATTIVWRRAHEDAAQESGVLVAEEAEDLEALVASLLDDMQPPFRDMLLMKIGSLAEAE